jgi:hypothetical protein
VIESSIDKPNTNTIIDIGECQCKPVSTGQAQGDSSAMLEQVTQDYTIVTTRISLDPRKYITLDLADR